jgi:hypothetical protein
MFQHTEGDLSKNMLDSIRQCPTPLFDFFFSAVNTNEIQSQLRIIIKEKTGYVIAKQSPEELSIVMRNIYVLYGNQSANIETESRRLNSLVLEIIVPMVATGISQYLGYVRDASQMHVPMERSKNVSQKGRNTFELFKGN